MRAAALVSAYPRTVGPHTTHTHMLREKHKHRERQREIEGETHSVDDVA